MTHRGRGFVRYVCASAPRIIRKKYDAIIYNVVCLCTPSVGGASTHVAGPATWQLGRIKHGELGVIHRWFPRSGNRTNLYGVGYVADSGDECV